MRELRICQCDPDAAMFLPWAKKKALALKESGLKHFDKTFPIGNATVRIKDDGFVLKVFLSANSGATDYVAMMMPNPVPYRGVSIGVVDKSPTYTVISSITTYWSSGGVAYSKNTQIINLSKADGTVIAVIADYQIQGYSGGWKVYEEVHNFNPYHPGTPYWHPEVLAAKLTATWQFLDYVMTNGGGAWDGFATLVSFSWSVTTPSYESLLTPEFPGVATYVMASDGAVLASEVQNYPAYPPSGALGTQYLAASTWFTTEPVGMPEWMFNYIPTGPGMGYWFDHKLTYAVPEDCIYPAPLVTPPTYGNWGSDGATQTTNWNTDWATGVTAFNARRKAWFKKNSDEFISALKYGFSATYIDANGNTQPVPGVTRAELKTGKLPDAWDFIIKRDVDVKYNNYPKDANNIFVGRHTHRAIQYTETAWTDTVQSDTSAGLSQAGLMVTQRVSTLSYTIGTEVRTATITGYLTQTVTQHNDAQGNWLGLSQRDVYDTWYNQEGTTLPAGVPSTIAAPYLKDRTASRIGIVLNGTVQNGYNADSTLGPAGNPLTYAAYVPPYPKASSTVTATVPDYITTWHKDAKITYDKTGVSASNVLNDSAMYGVTEIQITPIGLIADSAVTYAKSTALTGYPSVNGGKLKSGIYYARLYAYGLNSADQLDNTQFVNASQIATVTVNVTNNDGAILFTFAKMQVYNSAHTLVDVPLYALNVMFGDQSYWIFPGGAAPYQATVTDMTMGYPHPFPDTTTAERGIFGEGDGNRVKMYGTAVYKFDWQTGALTFKSWKPVHDANGVEIASKVVNISGGKVWSNLATNCLITYKGLNWPDVIAALKVRDTTLNTTDPALYSIVTAKKAS